MSLIHRKVTPKRLAANRANARKSTGPRSKHGKTYASQHMVRRGVFAEVLKAGMRGRGENTKEYARQREALYNAFRPDDGFEEMLVEDMAHLRWRWQRLMRAEPGLVASKKRQYENEPTAWTDAGVAEEGTGQRHATTFERIYSGGGKNAKEANKYFKSNVLMASGGAQKAFFQGNLGYFSPKTGFPWHILGGKMG